jgi:S1-C subfamily serine protease
LSGSTARSCRPSRGNIGIGFAVPVNMAANVMKSLIETGTVSRGFLGVGGDPITPDIAEQVHLPKDATGVIVTDTVPDGPRTGSGVKRGDVIVSVNGKPVRITTSFASRSPRWRRAAR